MRVRVAALLTAILTASCLGPGTTQAVRYYSLSAVLPDQPTAAARMRVGIMPVSMPHYLKRPELITRRGAEVVPLAYSVWAAPLDPEFARVLAQNLARALPDHDFASFPWRRGFAPAQRLEVEVERFEIEDEQAVLHARWRVLDADGTQSRMTAQSRIHVPIATGATPVQQVDALSEALGRLAAEVAQAYTQ